MQLSTTSILQRIQQTGAAQATVGKPAADYRRPFVPYLEGLRGAGALFIVFGHGLLALTFLRPGLGSGLPFFEHINDFGHGMVGMFFVVSGYALGLPVARNGQRFRWGVGTFAKRRAWRILPAYYAALCLAIPISLFTARTFGEEMPAKEFVLSAGLHVLMLHDLVNRLIGTIDTPMWSVAVECDIYVIFAILLVPLARRFGFVPMVLVSFALGLFPVLVGALRHQHGFYPLSQASPWYIGLFALGYAAAHLSIDDAPGAVATLERWPWQLLAIGAAIGAIVTVAFSPPGETAHGTRWLQDVFTGAALASQFVADSRARRNGRTTWFERCFQFRPFVFVGAFSYSLYLIHQPLMDLFAPLLRSNWSDAQAIGVEGFATAFAVAVAYPFYLVFERPFVSSYRREGDLESVRAPAQAEIQIPDPA
jgi:peptidoglycan/LPS O-acetylase OafA/YrhL